MKKNRLFKVFGLVTIITMMAEVISPFIVKAEPRNFVVFFSVEDGAGYTLVARNAQNQPVADGQQGVYITVENAGDGTVFLEGMDGSNQKYTSDNVTAVCNNNSCTVAFSGVEGVRYSTPGGCPFVLWNTDADNEYNGTNTLLTNTTHIELRNPVQVGPEFAPYQGSAYLVWKNPNGGTYFHLINNINSSSDMDYYTASSMTDQSKTYGPNETVPTFNDFNKDSRTRGYVVAGNLALWIEAYKAKNNVTTIDWTTVDTKELLEGNIGRLERELISNGTCTDDGDEESLHRCVDSNATVMDTGIGLQPIGEPTFNNSYISYGDNNFRITIYNDNYKGISLGDVSSLHYVPYFWDGFGRVDAYDISNTTKNNPQEIIAVLLESNFTFKELNYNSLNIQTVKALDVPEGAVDVAKVSGEWNFTFNSHYYDNVVFELTDTANQKYYIRINRMTFDPYIHTEWTPNGPGDATLMGDFYFDSNTSNTDYEITAKIVYKNGKTKTVVMENANDIEMGGDNHIFAPETNGGTNLKVATYKINLESDYEEKIDSVYFNIKKTGSTSTNYAGTFAGSGNGIYMKIESRRG